MRDVTKLITFSIALTNDGNIQTDLEYINDKKFQIVMDEWNPEYEATPAIACMIRNVVRDLFGINEVIGKYLR